MRPSRPLFFGSTTTAICAILFLAAYVVPTQAQNVLPPLLNLHSEGSEPAALRTDNNSTLHMLGAFLGVGGYFLTDPTGRAAIGNVKFFGDTALFVRPARFGIVTLTGGLEIMGASDHFLPFSGGNGFDLIGPAFRISTRKDVGTVHPYIIGGLYLGHLRSERLGFDRSDFTPGMGIGVEWKAMRYISLTGDYRFSERIYGYSMNGFSLSLHLF